MVTKESLKKLRAFKENVSPSSSIEKMYLFGSQVRGGTHAYSDYDILIVSKMFRGIDSRYRSLGFYKHWKLNAPFDFLCYTPEEFKRLKKGRTIVSEAIKEGIEI